jgi:hypothetical protein
LVFCLMTLWQKAERETECQSPNKCYIGILFNVEICLRNKHSMGILNMQADSL